MIRADVAFDENPHLRCAFLGLMRDEFLLEIVVHRLQSRVKMKVNKITTLPTKIYIDIFRRSGWKKPITTTPQQPPPPSRLKAGAHAQAPRPEQAGPRADRCKWNDMYITTPRKHRKYMGFPGLKYVILLLGVVLISLQFVFLVLGCPAGTSRINGLVWTPIYK